MRPEPSGQSTMQEAFLEVDCGMTIKESRIEAKKAMAKSTTKIESATRIETAKIETTLIQ